MDWLTFISNMAAALAWPMVVGVIAFAFRPELRQVLSTLRRVKLGPMEAETFAMGTREARKLAEALPNDDTLTNAPSTQPREGNDRRRLEIDDELLKLVEGPGLTTRRPIMRAWDRVEDAIRAMADRNGIKDPDLPVMSLVVRLRALNLISEPEFDLVAKLFKLRNNVATMPGLTFTEDGVLDYLVAANSVLRMTAKNEKPK